jgi:hypothetical protein
MTDDAAPPTCATCGETHWGVNEVVGPDGTSWTCGKCAVCGTCGHREQNPYMRSRPTYLAQLRQYLHAVAWPTECVRCVDCGVDCVESTPACKVVMPTATYGPPPDGSASWGLRCAVCSRPCACGCGTTFKQYCAAAKLSWVEAADVKKNPWTNTRWRIPSHRPCNKCGGHVGHGGEPETASPGPAGACFKCGNCVHGIRHGRWGVTHVDKVVGGLILHGNGEHLLAHETCVRCEDCGGGPVLADKNHGMTVRKLGADATYDLQVIHSECRTCLYCKKKGDLTTKVPGKGTRQRTKTVGLSWRKTPRGTGWVHKPCVEEPPKKRAKLDVK